MKNLYCILTLLILTMHSCMRHSYSPRLVTADSLCHTNPDSAMRMLGTMSADTTGMGSDDLWYYRLLCIKAADKAYIKPASSKEADRILRHYEDGGDSRLLSEAYFYAGSVYRDLNDAPQAIEYFQKALKCMPEEKKRMKSNIYNQIGQLFILQGLSDLAVKSYLEAYKIDMQLKDTINIIYSLRDIGFAYNRQNKTDTCELAFKEALSLAQAKGDSSLIQDIRLQLAGIYAEIKEYAKALTLINKCNIIEEHADRSAAFAIAATIYTELGSYDTARIYCDSLLAFGNVYAKKAAYRHLLQISREKNEYGDVNKYAGKYEEYCDSVERIGSQETTANIHAHFNYNLRTQEIARLKAQRAKNIIIATVIMLALAICTCIALYMSYKIKRKNDKQRNLLNKLRRYQYEMTQEYRKANLMEIENLEHQISIYKDKNKGLTELLKEQRAILVAANKRSEICLNDQETFMQNIHGTNIYKTILDKIKATKPLSAEEWHELDIAINGFINNFRERLYEACNMNEHEYSICMLIKIDVKMKDIATLVGRSPSAITMSRKRMHAKIFGKAGHGSDFDTFIKSL